MDLPKRERIEQQGVLIRVIQQHCGLADRLIKQLRLPEFPGRSGQQGQCLAAFDVGAAQGPGLVQPSCACVPVSGFAEFVAVHPQDVSQQGWLCDLCGGVESLACPAGGGEQSFFGEDVAERGAEGDPGVGEQDCDIAFGPATCKRVPRGGLSAAIAR